MVSIGINANTKAYGLRSTTAVDCRKIWDEELMGKDEEGETVELKWIAVAKSVKILSFLLLLLLGTGSGKASANGFIQSTIELKAAAVAEK